MSLNYPNLYPSLGKQQSWGDIIIRHHQPGPTKTLLGSYRGGDNGATTHSRLCSICTAPLATQRRCPFILCANVCANVCAMCAAKQKPNEPRRRAEGVSSTCARREVSPLPEPVGRRQYVNTGCGGTMSRGCPPRETANEQPGRDSLVGFSEFYRFQPRWLRVTRARPEMDGGFDSTYRVLSGVAKQSFCIYENRTKHK